MTKAKKEAQAKEMIDAMSEDGAWNHDSYLHGQLNGMILMDAHYRGESPTYKGAPKGHTPKVKPRKERK